MSKKNCQLRELMRRGDPAGLLAPAEAERMRAAVMDEAGRTTRPRPPGVPTDPRQWPAAPWPGLAAAAASGLVLALSALLAWKVSWAPPAGRFDGRSNVTAPEAEIRLSSSTTAPPETDAAGASTLPRQIQFWTPGGTHIIWRLVPPPAASEAGDHR